MLRVVDLSEGRIHLGEQELALESRLQGLGLLAFREWVRADKHRAVILGGGATSGDALPHLSDTETTFAPVSAFIIHSQHKAGKRPSARDKSGVIFAGPEGASGVVAQHYNARLLPWVLAPGQRYQDESPLVDLAKSGSRVLTAVATFQPESPGFAPEDAPTSFDVLYVPESWWNLELPRVADAPEYAVRLAASLANTGLAHFADQR